MFALMMMRMKKAVLLCCEEDEILCGEAAPSNQAGWPEMAQISRCSLCKNMRVFQENPQTEPAHALFYHPDQLDLRNPAELTQLAPSSN